MALRKVRQHQQVSYAQRATDILIVKLAELKLILEAGHSFILDRSAMAPALALAAPHNWRHLS